MTFQPEKAEAFLKLFNRSKNEIRNFEGCLSLELFQDVSSKSVFITYSRWQSEEALQQYRESDLFKETWAQVKPLFIEKAEAWTVGSVLDL